MLNCHFDLGDLDMAWCDDVAWTRIALFVAESTDGIFRKLDSRIADI